ncbi:MAG: HDOD domain-containing protein [Terriglobales bacterium]
MDVFVARQTIFDRNRKVYGYELLFRASAESTSFDGVDGAMATTRVLANSLLSVGLDHLLDGKKAFINFDRTLLVGGLHEMLPPEMLVVEVLESVVPDEEVLAACRNLEQRGYRIALDDFVRGPQTEPLIPFATIVKLDMRATSREEQQRLIGLHKPKGILMLAEKVETVEEYDWAHAAGYDFFQGYFFTRPVLVRGRQIPSVKLTSLKLLAMMQNSDLDFGELEKLISADVSLAFKLLRFANSALFTRSAEVRSIDHALALIGESGVRHWVALATLPVMAKDKPHELIVQSLVRARLCERLAQLSGMAQQEFAFLMGLFSLLDALIDLPIADALAQVKIVPQIEHAILGTSDANDRFRLVLELVRRYEAADWDAVGEYAAKLRIEEAALTQAYTGSALWAQQSLTATSGKEARKRVRHAASGSLRILWEDSEGKERVMNARLVNVSTHGLQLQVSEKIPARTSVSCNDAKRGISGRGSVRYCNYSKGSYVVGVEFSAGTGFRGKT